MTCEDIQEQLGALLDNQLDATSAAAVRAHLEECAECRSERAMLATLHDAISQTLADDRSRCDVVAETVLRRFASGETSHRPGLSSSRTVRRFVGYLLAAAGGFLLAVVLDRGPVEEPQLPAMVSAPRLLPAAYLVHATGPVLVRTSPEQIWMAVDRGDVSAFTCPKDAAVKTEQGVLCELATPKGSRIRLNESSEITLKDDEQLELVRGQIWCRGPEDDVLRVITRAEPPEPRTADNQPPGKLWTLTCPTNCEAVTTVAGDEPMQVVSAAGQVDVQLNGSVRQLNAGEVCRVFDGEVSIHESPPDLLAAERWMHPLLMLGGHDSPELSKRVDSLLAQIGRTKVSLMYERDLRSLGEYGAVPLIKFVRSEASRAEPSRRTVAMNVVADTAPAWMIPDLIALLNDEEPHIRRLAAQGLQRLTGETQHVPLEVWQQDRSQWQSVIADWQQWWQDHRTMYPVPPRAAPSR